MQDKILNALDTHKQEVASKMYGASDDTPTEEEEATDENV